MGSWFSGGLTGEGHHDLGAYVVLNDIYYIVDSNTNPRVLEKGNEAPTRLLYAGIIGGSYMGTGPGGVTNYPFVGFWFKLEWLAEDPGNQHGDWYYGCDRIFWKLPTGLSISIGVSW